MNFLEVLWLIANLFVWWNSDPSDGPDEERVSRRGIVAALILLLMLVVIGVRIIDVLRQTGILQDCVMQGRTNCVPSIR